MLLYQLERTWTLPPDDLSVYIFCRSVMKFVEKFANFYEMKFLFKNWNFSNLKFFDCKNSKFLKKNKWKINKRSICSVDTAIRSRYSPYIHLLQWNETSLWHKCVFSVTYLKLAGRWSLKKRYIGEIFGITGEHFPES